MGDRGNIVLDYSTTGKAQPRIFLYTHWGGTELPDDVRKALLFAPDRWDDPAYLAGAIFKTMMGEGGRYCKQPHGHGITPYRTDFEHPDVVVLLESQQVQIGTHVWTFKEYVDLGSASKPVEYPEDAKLPKDEEEKA